MARGRRPGSSGTREAILAAARDQFGEKGYDGATIRGIARQAGVDPALVHHYFGAKDQVFVAAMDLPYDPADLLRSIIAESTDDPARAENAIRSLLEAWERPDGRTTMLALVRSAVSNDRAAAMIRGFLTDAIAHRAVGPAGVTPIQAGLIASQLIGLLVLRYVIAIEPIASATHDDIVAYYAPALRAVLESAGGRLAGSASDPVR
ncbi:TetR/AcrR family transcriptional regulator [Marinitenerispora sediminis]|uniref:TetR family transcriptional regulator n=1 Tax=Marinitenerispora sediminis TaxID=1931232 RepID=A0A368SZA6_9ACTN|nr:TetR family transcriptional regulator [Marinitenerispora sediminis]RCV48811.1 TetR family transcriptional regulator [Marinitenerispora sediminis]RCV49982.1 TetR family transcriptional regulator [Marinitenerispora sediminis]RCV50745.1 TetR family transcriptional regulator [Marinitenerispora sediminis]